jgi:hypothetical protein
VLFFNEKHEHDCLIVCDGLKISALFIIKTIHTINNNSCNYLAKNHKISLSH